MLRFVTHILRFVTVLSRDQIGVVLSEHVCMEEGVSPMLVLCKQTS